MCSLGHFQLLQQITVWVVCKQQTFLIVLGARRSKVRPWHIQCLVGARFWFLDGCLLAVSSQVGRGQGDPLESLFYRRTNPIHEGSTLLTYSPPKDPTFKHHHLGG